MKADTVMKHGKELKIGIFAAVTLAGSFFVINYLRGRDVFHREMDLRGRFENVGGLVPSAAVQYRGCKAGQVTSVEYRPETDDFEVTCSIDRKFIIPADSRMAIVSTSIMGGKGIVLEAGESDRAAEDGDELRTVLQADLVETLAENIGPVIDGLSGTMRRLDEAIGNLNSLLGEENRADIRRILSDLRRTMANLLSISGGVNAKSAELQTFISQLADISVKLDSLAVKADGTMDSIGKFASNLEKSDVEGLVDSVTRLSESIQNPEGTVGKLLWDGEIYDSADSLITGLGDLVSKIRENPKKYLKISVF